MFQHHPLKMFHLNTDWLRIRARSYLTYLHGDVWCFFLQNNVQCMVYFTYIYTRNKPNVDKYDMTWILWAKYHYIH